MTVKVSFPLKDPDTVFHFSSGCPSEVDTVAPHSVTCRIELIRQDTVTSPGALSSIDTCSNTGVRNGSGEGVRVQAETSRLANNVVVIFFLTNTKVANNP